MTKESLADFFESKLFAGIVAGVCIMLVIICIFESGVLVGYHEATYSSHWGENYGRNFGSGPMSANGLPDARLPLPDGTMGKILSISNASASSTQIVISNTQNAEEKVLIDTNTIIRDHENTISASTLVPGAYAVVLGSPDEHGEILAKLIRLVPAPITTQP